MKSYQSSPSNVTSQGRVTVCTNLKNRLQVGSDSIYVGVESPKCRKRLFFKVWTQSPHIHQLYCIPETQMSLDAIFVSQNHHNSYLGGFDLMMFYSNTYGLPWRLSDKESTCQRKTQVRSLGREDPLAKEMTTHSSILAWRMDRVWWATVHGFAKESDTTQQQQHVTHTHTHTQL